MWAMSDHGPHPHADNRSALRQRALIVFGILLILGGIVWLWLASSRAPDSTPMISMPTMLAPATVDQLTSGDVASMDSPIFNYSPGWQVSAAGADPHEPIDPWAEPAGTLAFKYHGRELALALAEGDYWGYLYVTVDGAPANQLANVSGNGAANGEPAGYKTFYAPELAGDGEPVVRWRAVHAAAGDGPHDVQIEVWRSWGQTPLRGMAVDAQPVSPWPLWPAVALIVAGIWLLVLGVRAFSHDWSRPAWLQSLRRRLALPPAVEAAAPMFASLALIVLIGGTAFELWWLSLAGVGLLAFAALLRPALWIAALLFGLPFYFAQTLPLLPGRAFSLIDVGVFGGIALLIGRRALFGARWPTTADVRSLALPQNRGSGRCSTGHSRPLSVGH